jgi:NitT/TauT family transport system substrate-binding protein
VALEKGFYEQEKLTVTIREGRGSSVTVQTVAAGVDHFGWADFGVLAGAVVKGLPVKGIAGVIQKGTAGIITLQESGIKKPQDLVGKTVALFAGSFESVLFPAFLAASGVDKKDIKIVSITPRARYPALMNKKVDATGGSTPFGVSLVESKGFKTYSMLYADYGVNTLGHGILTNTDLIKKDPGLAGRFVKATLKGWQYSVTHPEEAINTLIKLFPKKKDRKGAFLRQLSLLFQNLTTENTKGKPLGWQSQKDWERTVTTLKKYGRLEKLLPVENFYTNQFILK